MTIKFEHLCVCGHMSHIDLTKTEVVVDEQVVTKGSVTTWCDNCGATGYKRVRVPSILGTILLLFGQIK